MSPITSLGRRDWDFDTEDSAAFGEEMRLKAEKLKEENKMETQSELMIESNTQVENPFGLSNLTSATRALGTSMTLVNELEFHRKQAKEQQEALELVAAYAQDIVDNWSELTMRKLGEMTKRVDTLRQALEAARK